MKKNLDTNSLLKKFDSGQVLESVKNLSKQFRQAKKEMANIDPPAKYRQVKNILVMGMGGSALGSDLIGSFFLNRLKIPIYKATDYHLPKFAGKNTLYISSSYSGNTEESLAMTQDVIRKKYPIFIITSGGKLASLAKKYSLPAYVFKPHYNPSGQPRLGLGYSVTCQLMLLKKLKLLSVGENEISAAIDFMELKSKAFHENTKTRDNLAKKIAQACYGRIPIIFAGSYLAGNAHVICNQIHENAKNFAAYYLLPELNHHLLEGLAHPLALKNSIFLCLESGLDSPKINKRFAATKMILRKKHLKVETINVLGDDRIKQSLWSLSFGGFFSFYLAMLNQEDPVLIPWVNFLKKKLSAK